MELSLSVRYISVGNPDDLASELSSMATDETGYINAADFEEMTGERWDELSTAGRRLIGDIAAQSWCAIRVQHDRIFFTRK
jgi:hypothetical protein